MKKINLLLVSLLISLASIAQYSPQYYREVTIYNNFNTAISNYAGLLILDTKSLISAGYMKADGSDIRFTTSKCNFLLTGYWIEKGINTDSTYIWVRVPSIGGNDSALVYMYYGDNNAPANSNFNATFPSRLISTGNSTLASGSYYRGWIDIKAGHELTISGNAPLELIGSYINISGKIIGNGKGYAAPGYDTKGTGTGGGAVNFVAGAGGGSHGGVGGTGGYDTGDAPNHGGPLYDFNNTINISVGSSGGSGQNVGGNGGGAVILKGNSVNVSGEIQMDGSDASIPALNRGGGGGAGGGILIYGDTVTINGFISAKGGSVSNGQYTISDDGGGGGGGRIKVFHDNSYIFSGTYNVSGGNGGIYGEYPPEDGGAGTFFDSTISYFRYGRADIQLPYPGGAVYITDSVSICQGDSAFLGGDYQDTAGTYIDSFTAAYGCDSIRTTRLIINPVFYTPLTKAICQGDSLFLGGSYRKSAGIYYDSLFSKNGCDSVVATTLIINPVYLISNFFSICQGDSIFISHKYRKTAGIFTDSLKTVQGCDSIIVNTLVVNPVYSSFLFVPICKGDSILIAGKYRKTAGLYSNKLKTVLGCDSIIDIILSVDSANTGVTVSSNMLTATATGASYQWLNCSDNSPIAGETSQTFTATVNGTYAVQVTENNCTDTSACYQVTGIGINEVINNNGITVYPNPASKEINIRIESADNKKAAITLLNSLGQPVYEFTGLITDNFSIPVDNLPAGIYFIKVRLNSVEIRKIMIQP